MIKSDIRPPTSWLLFSIATGETADRVYAERLSLCEVFFRDCYFILSFSQRKNNFWKGSKVEIRKKSADMRERIFLRVITADTIMNYCYYAYYIRLSN